MPGKRKSTRGDGSSAPPSKRARIDGDTTPATPLPAGPGGPMEIVFSFDTTGSMSSCLAEVRKNLTDMINRLQKDIPGLRMAVFAHGDYCDARNYVTKYVDFTNDVTKLVDFVNNVKDTHGGDADECYELVLYEVRTKLSWSPGTQRSLVMIGDADPHEPDYPQNTLKLDWRKEIDNLKSEGVRIYGVDCSSGLEFYKSLASKTGGKHLQLKDWNNVFDMMMGICYREHGAEFFKAYEHEVRSRGPMISREMDVMLNALRHSDESDDSDGGSAAVTSSTTAATGSRTSTKADAGSRTPAKRPKKRKTFFRPVSSAPAKKTTKDGRYHRENLTQLPHVHLSLEWSRWRRLISPRKPRVSRSAKYWKPTRPGFVGFRRMGLFKGKTQKPAFYEIGVTRPFSERVYAVYYHVTDGFKGACNIDAAILNGDHLTAQINDVIMNGCDVYIRRAELPPKVDIDNVDGTSSVCGAQELRDFVKSKFEYAWHKGAYGRRRHRLIVKRGVKISSDEF